MSAEITIIGAGISGMMCAWHLTRLGAEVQLLERGEAGQEASWAGGGILSPLHPWRYPPELLQLSHRSQELFPQLAQQLREETGIDPEWEKSGLLIIDQHEIHLARQWGHRWRMEVQQVAGQQLRDLEPALNPKIDTALYLPQIAQIRNPRLLKCLRTSLERRGVPILEHLEIAGLVERKDKVVALQTTQGNIPVHQVVVTTGAWSGKLLAKTGPALPVEPVLGQMLLIGGTPGVLHRVTLRGDRYLIPRRDGMVLAGSTLEHRGFDKTLTEEAKKSLWNAALELAPPLGEYPIIRQWSGLRPGSPRGVPFIGKHPRLENLYINAGHYRNGLMLAPACAELLASVMRGESPRFDPGIYAPGRIEP